jgi:L-ascorbate metabolism protein UlaG (beta-lactamase superfamily)/predicted ester cyclase
MERPSDDPTMSTNHPDLLPPDVAPAGAQPPDILFTLPAGSASEKALRIVRIGHSSVLVQWGEDTLLTDPWFSQKRSYPGYYPGESLGMGVDALPNLTGVLGSMDHWDHFDMQAFAAYRDRAVPIIVPTGTTQRTAALGAGFTDVRALDPWGAVQLGAFRVTAVCAKPDTPATAWEYEHAYVLEVDGHTVLFCSHLMTPEVQAEVAARWPRVDVAFLAVNALCLKQRNYHQLSMTPEDAAALCKRLDVRVAIPIHYTFHGNWASEAFMLSHRGTPEGLTVAARAQSPKTTVMTLTPGQRLDVQWGDGPRAGGGAAEQKKASLLAFFAKLNAGDLSAFDLFTPGFVHHHPLPGADPTREGARRGMARMREAIPDMRIAVDAVIVEGEVAAARIVNSGTLKQELPGFAAPPGPVQMNVTMLYRFEGAQIAEEWFDVDASTRWRTEGAPTTTKYALSIGWHPDAPGLPMAAADVRRDLDEAKERLDKLGYPTDLCLLRGDEPSDMARIEETLRARRYDAIVVGAGIRLQAKHHLLFEKIVNVVHARAPHARICFNTTPLDTSDAVLRWITGTEEKSQ